MAKIRRIYDDTLKPDGTRLTIYPITSSRAVYTPESVALSTILNEGYRFGGIVTPTDIPDIVDQRVFYLGATAGTYSSFGNFAVSTGEVAALCWDGTEWSCQKFTVGSTIDEATVASWGFTKNVGTVTGVTVNGTAATVGSDGNASVNISVPSEVTETTVSGWGFTKNQGTVTAVKVNDQTYNPTSGVVDLGSIGGGGGTAGTLKTNNTSTLSTSASESLSGNISLHQVSKTGKIGDLVDVTLTTPSSGQILSYNGTAWVNAPVGTMQYRRVTSADYADLEANNQLVEGVLYVIVDDSIFTV